MSDTGFEEVLARGSEPTREQVLSDIAAVARRKAEVRSALGLLEERQREHVLILRSWGWGYGAIADKLGISRSRVQQIVNG